MKAIYFDAFSGVSGDMTLGALLHAGLPLEYLKTELQKLGVGGYRLEVTPARQHGISGLKFDVILENPDGEHHRHLSEILSFIQNSSLAEKVKSRAKQIFRALAEAEAKIHNISPEQVHFHEVGAVDAIVDIVGSCIGFDWFGLEEFYCSALPLGAGFVKAAHGILPVPAPATLELLAKAGAPAVPQITLSDGSEYPPRRELVTPTGAAIVSTLCQFRRPQFKLEKTGYGFGSYELPWPNALRLWIGETGADTNSEKPSPETLFQHDTVSVLETNLDDMSGEGLGYLLDKLLAEGAMDVYFTPIQMKKNRPAVLLGVIAQPQDEAKLAGIILRETSAFGLRVSQKIRYKVEREIRRLSTPEGEARAKLKISGGEVVEAAPEYEDVVAIARKTGRPWREIYEEIRSEATRRFTGKDPAS